MTHLSIPSIRVVEGQEEDSTDHGTTEVLELPLERIASEASGTDVLRVERDAEESKTLVRSCSTEDLGNGSTNGKASAHGSETGDTETVEPWHHVGRAVTEEKGMMI